MTLGEYLRDRLREGMAGAIGDAESELTRIAQAGGAAVHTAPPASGGGSFDLVGEVLGVLGALAAFAFPLIEVLKKIGTDAGGQGVGFGAGWILGTILSNMIDPLAQEIYHAVGDAVQSGIFDPNTAAGLEAKRIIDNTYGRSEAAGGNLSGEHYDRLVRAAEQHPDVGQLLSMLNLDLIPESQVDASLRHHAIPDVYVQALKGLRRQLLSPADLALANLRGAIDNTTMSGYARQLGVTDADMQVLIANTGEPPGPEQLMEALRRGFIDRARFERGIRQSRVRNEWMDVERRLAYSPMTAEEAVRAVVENYISHAEGGRIAQQNGLDPAHWPILVESWGRPLAHGEMMTLYHRGQASIGQVQQAMRESDIKNKYISQSVELGRRLIPERQMVSMLQHGAIDAKTAARKLLELGYSREDVSLFIRLGQNEHRAQVKDLTKGEILGLLRDSLITRSQAHGRLVKIGYTGEVATWLVRLEEAKAHASKLRGESAAIKASLLAHRLTAEQATGQLVRAGVDRTQATNLVTEWTRERGRPTKTLTVAELASAARHKVVGARYALKRIQQLGYDHLDAVILLESHGITPAELGEPVLDLQS